MPADVPAAAVDAARETIGGAAAVAGQLPAGQAAVLFGMARDAFTSGLNAVAAVSTATIVGVAFTVWVVLRRKTAQAEETTTP